MAQEEENKREDKQIDDKSRKEQIQTKTEKIRSVKKRR